MSLAYYKVTLVFLQPVANVIKLFTAVSYVFVPGKPFKPSLMFAGKARAYLSEAPSRCSTLGYSPGPTHKHLTKL